MSVISVSKSHLSEMCRVCLSPVNGPFTDIFSAGRPNLPTTIAAAVMECAPVHITQGDGLPAFICNSCNNNLAISHQFRTQCLRSETILQRYISQINSSLIEGSATSFSTENSSSDKDNFNDKNDVILVKNNFPETFGPVYIKQECSDDAAQANRTADLSSGSFESSKTTAARDASQVPSKNITSEYRAVNGSAIKHNNTSEGGAFGNSNGLKIKFPSESGNCYAHMDVPESNKFTNSCFVSEQNTELQYKFMNAALNNSEQTTQTPTDKTNDKQYSSLSNAAMVLPEHNFESYLVKLFTKEEDRPHKCNVCEKTFKRSSNLSEHSKVHSECRPYKCEICQKWFKRSCDLAEHKRSHSNERPFKCTICQKSFKRNCDLSEHTKIHTNERPFECDICHKGFKRNGQFLEHRRIHTGERPYECDICHQHFRTSSKLSAHSKVHNEERTHKCNICSKCFKSYKSLTIHSRVHSVDNN